MSSMVKTDGSPQTVGIRISSCAMIEYLNVCTWPVAEY